MSADLDARPVRRGTPAVIRLLVLATFVVILNETIMINAIPRLMEDLEVTERAAQWVSTAFMLTMAAIIPATGWLVGLGGDTRIRSGDSPASGLSPP